MNWILTVVRNGLAYTRAAIPTFRAQDVGDVKVLAIDNASADGTHEYLRSEYPFVITLRKDPPLSVAASWNKGLGVIFQDGFPHVLVVNNDVELAPRTYSLLLRYLAKSGAGFVTAIGVRERAAFECNLGEEGPVSTSPHPDFSCFLITREVYEKVGPFDEKFEGAYAEDLDYHIRMHKAGIDARALCLPYLHHASGTLRCASDEERREIQLQADRNRAYFRRKWGVAAGSAEYYALFEDDRLAAELRNQGSESSDEVVE